MEYLEDSHSILIDEVQELKQKVDNLEILITEKFSHLEKILEQSKLNNVQESLSRMNSHIDFVNETYSTLQTPLNYFKHKVEYLMGYDYYTQTQSLPSCSSLPSIKDKDDRDNYTY